MANMLDDLTTTDLDNFTIDLAGRVYCLRCQARIWTLPGATVLELTKACNGHVCG